MDNGRRLIKKLINNMKVLHFGTLDAIQGGPAMSTYLTLYGLRQEGVDAQIAMYKVPDNHKLRGYEVPINWCKEPWEHKFGYSPKLKGELTKIENVDIYHAQGVWQYPTYAICDVAKSKGKPYLITPRGMLYPQDIAKSNAAFKKLSLRWRLLKDLNKAACVHVTCEDELKYCRDLGVTSPIAIIPNPVEVKEYMPQKYDGVFRLGYMGRLSPRKNVESLIYAFANPQLKNAELIIIGGGDDQYEAFLRKEVIRLGLKNVVFKGFLNGKEKDDALSTISVLAMPSSFENLGNVILEALVRGIPCIATKGAPWKDLVDNNCGWWVDYDQKEIEQAVLKASNTNVQQLKAMGENGKKLIKDRYSVQSVSKAMKHLYEWICSDIEKPKFVNYD